MLACSFWARCPAKSLWSAASIMLNRDNILLAHHGELVGASPDLPYKNRASLLKENGIALWDVCAAGSVPEVSTRRSSFRPSKRTTSAGFSDAHTGVDLICFNGKRLKRFMTARCGKRPRRPIFERIRYDVLPSTSPAHAGMPYEQKLSRWRSALSGAQPMRPPEITAASNRLRKLKLIPATKGATS